MNLGGVTLLDGDIAPNGGTWVEGGGGCGDVEGHLGPPGGHGVREGSDLVGHVAVGGNPIGAHYHGVDFAGGQETTRRGVGDHGDRYARVG